MATTILFDSAILLGVAFLLYFLVALEFEIRRTHRQESRMEQATRNSDDHPRINVLIHRESNI